MSKAKSDESDLSALLCAFDGKNPVVEVFHEEPDNTFVSGVVGAIPIHCLIRIEEEVYDTLDKGDGMYIVKCFYNPASYIDGGLHEGDYWELDVVSHEDIGA